MDVMSFMSEKKHISEPKSWILTSVLEETTETFPKYISWKGLQKANKLLLNVWWGYSLLLVNEHLEV